MKLNNTRSTNRMLPLRIMENRVLPLSQSIYSQTLNTMHISKISVSKHVVWKTGFSQETNTFYFNEVGLMTLNSNLLTLSKLFEILHLCFSRFCITNGDVVEIQKFIDVE